MARRNKTLPAGRDKASANMDGKGFGQIPRVLVESLAYRSIKSLAAAKALPVFIIKFSHTLATTGKPVCGFTYGEAEELHGIPRKSFTRGLQELHALGFIDVVEKGGVWDRNQWTATSYRISERWRKYGTHEFIKLSWTTSEPAKKAKPPKRYTPAAPIRLPSNPIHGKI